jgi:hypothetical protein
VRARRLSSVAIVVGLGVLAFAASASAAGSAGHRAATKVSIKSWPDGLFGIVASHSMSCARGRGVKVFKQRGAARHPNTDKLIGTATARKREHASTFRGTRAFQWSLRHKVKRGRFYAKARTAEGCRSDFSQTYRALPRGDIPPCPSTEPVCHFEQLHFDGNCGSFTKYKATCHGDSTSGRYPWNASSADFRWNGDPKRDVIYSAYAHNTSTAGLIGTVPDPGSAAYSITGACGDATNPDDLWVTPNLAGVAPGDQGGPLHIDYKAHDFGTDDVYITGYLYYWGKRKTQYCG